MDRALQMVALKVIVYQHCI